MAVVVVIVIFYTATITEANSRGAVRKIDPVKKMLTAAESPKNVTKKQALFTWRTQNFCSCQNSFKAFKKDDDDGLGCLIELG